MTRFAIAVVVGLLTCACLRHDGAPTPSTNTSKPAVEEARSIDLSTVEFKLERTECYGWCPNYVVTIRGTGEVVYEGRSFVKDIGEESGSVPKETVQALFKQFSDADFFKLKREYVQSVTDLSTTYVSFKVGDKVWRVKNYWTGMTESAGGMGSQELKAHQLLETLALSIDGAANVWQWIGSEDERRALSRESKRRGVPGSSKAR